MSKVIIISDPRTGTHMLRTVLCNIGVHVENEIFNPVALEYIDEPTEELYNKTNSFVVHRATLDKNKKLVQLIKEDKEAKIIFVTRQNTLDSYLSLKVAIESNVWAIEDETKTSTQEIEFHAGEYIDHKIKTRERIRKYKSEFRRERFLYIDYDYLEEDFDVILEFVGAKGEFNPSTKKQEKRHQMEIVNNYFDMKRQVEEIDDGYMLQPYKPKTIILSDPRTGTHMLRTALCALGLEVDTELFNPRSPYFKEDWTTNQIYYNTDAVVTHRVYTNEQLKYLIANDPTAKIIFLTRENILDSFISFEIAKKTNQWSVLKETPYMNTYRVEFKASEYTQYKNDNNEIIEEFKKLLECNDNVLYITYDEVQNDFGKVTEFLNTEGEFNPYIKKQETRDLKQVVINYTQMEQLLIRIGDKKYLGL